MKCPGCGREGIEAGRFCQWCGHDLSPPFASAQPLVTPIRQLVDKRVMRLGLVLLAVAIIGTFVLSPLILTSESEEGEIVVDPYSYYAVRMEFYGIGILRYTEGQTSGSTSDVYILELNQANYERFVAGKDYNYNGYSATGVGGYGHSTESGTIWVKYIVFVNDNPIPATFVFGYHATSYASFLVAGPLSAGSLLIFLCAVILSKRHPSTI
jgi:hypothetical protein